MSWTATIVIAHLANEDVSSLRDAFRREGWRIINWNSVESQPAGAADADLVVVSEKLSASADETLGPFKPKNKPNGLVLALGMIDAPWASAVLNTSAEAKQLAARASALIRLVRLEDECRTRSASLDALGVGPLDTKGLKPPVNSRVLHIGGPTAAFSGLHATLSDFGIDLRPVLSAALALDEMEAGLVDAVLLDASASEQTVRELNLIMRRNSDLAMCPLLVLDPDDIYLRRPALVGDMIEAPTDETIIGIRLTQLIAENRRRRKALTLLSRSKVKGFHDARTGLHEAAFLHQHLKSLANTQGQSGRAFSIGVLKLTPLDTVLSPDEVVALAQQTGSLVARLIRAEDCAAALSDEHIAVLFPATLEAEAQIALRRIAAVLTATRFHAARHAEGVAGVVDWLVGEPSDERPFDDLFDDLKTGIGSKLKSVI